MTSQINEFYPYDLRANTEPSWVKAERLAYCENAGAKKREDSFKTSLHEFFSRIHR